VKKIKPVKEPALSFLDQKFENVPVHRKFEALPLQPSLEEKFKSKLRPM
jgi:hypothetical protein